MVCSACSLQPGAWSLEWPVSAAAVVIVFYTRIPGGAYSGPFGFLKPECANQNIALQPAPSQRAAIITEWVHPVLDRSRWSICGRSIWPLTRSPEAPSRFLARSRGRRRSYWSPSQTKKEIGGGKSAVEIGPAKSDEMQSDLPDSIRFEIGCPISNRAYLLLIGCPT